MESGAPRSQESAATAAVLASEKLADARRPAPEDAKAGAVAKAMLLEGSVRALREAGLPEQAEALEKEAAEQRRRVLRPVLLQASAWT